MLRDVTPAVERALDAAQLRAHQRSGAAVNAWDLLAALLADDEGRPFTLLGACGFAAAGWIAELPHVAESAALPAPLPFAPELSEVFFRAREYALLVSGERTVPSDALLLALVHVIEEVRTQLVARGLDLARLEAEFPGLSAPPVPLDEPLFSDERPASIETGRILDAAGNRAREALRVLEDCTRFLLDDAFLTASLKTLRHELTAALRELRGDLLLAARDTEHDVGTSLTTPGEEQRQSVRDVVAANCKRLQEALRSLEEYGKLYGGEFGARFEQLRYRSYTLERALLQGAKARERLAGCRLCVLVTGKLCALPLETVVKEAIAGGAGMIQLREKELSDRELLDRARQVRHWTRDAEVLFVVNDRADVARLCDADGVHLGQDDLPVKEARRLVGADALIGVSTHHIEQVRQALLDGADYLGVGPVFTSATKDFSEDALAGLDFVRTAAAETALPAFAIGGINASNLAEVVTAGGQRVAVSSAVCSAEAPRAVVQALLRLLVR
jgi:thiamine-phosphate pyrophosphorylase